MVTFGDPKVLDEAQRRFNDYVAGKGTIAADVRKAVYRAVAMQAHNHPSAWEDLLKLHRTAVLQEEILRIASSLGYARSKDLLLKVSISLSLSLLVCQIDYFFITIITTIISSFRFLSSQIQRLSVLKMFPGSLDQLLNHLLVGKLPGLISRRISKSTLSVVTIYVMNDKLEYTKL